MRRQLRLKQFLVATIVSGFANSAVYAESYTYDGSGRLSSVLYQEGSSLSFNMDAGGNLLELAAAAAAFNLSIALGNRTVADSNGVAGESVNFSATATPSATGSPLEVAQWLVNEAVVATGLTAMISLPDGQTMVTLKATNTAGASTSATVTITVEAPSSGQGWPTLYSGVSPDESLGIPFNNISALNPADGQIYSCLRVFSNGLPSSLEGVAQYDISFQIVSTEQGTIGVTRVRPFNATGALNEKGEVPDCSGSIELTSGVYDDTIQVGEQTYQAKFQLIDSANLTLRLLELNVITSSP